MSMSTFCRCLRVLGTLSAFALLMVSVSAQTSNITFQGYLRQDGLPANGTFNMFFRLFKNAVFTQRFPAVGTVAVTVTNGLFTRELTFDTVHFDGSALSLEINVDGTMLSPRVTMNPAPSAVFAHRAPWAGIIGAPGSLPPSGAAGGDLGGTYPNPLVTGLTLPINELAALPGTPTFFITNSAASGFAWGGVFESDSPAGVALLAIADSNTGTTYGVLGRADSPDGWAGYFINRIGVGSLATPQFSVSESDGDVAFSNPQGSITFPATSGANAPMIQMFASGTSNANRMVIAHSPGFQDWGLQYRDSNDTFHFLRAGSSVLAIGSNVGVGVEAPAYQLDVGARMRVRGGTGGTTAGIWFSNGTNDRAFFGLVNDNAVGLWGNAGAGWQLQMSTVNGNVGIGGAPTGEKLRVFGTARVNVLEIAGADLAEKFPTLEELKPGMVVEIDPSNPGHLRLSRAAYNRGVAGVVTGANDLSTGIVLGNMPGSEEGVPIALSGRVWVWCDASEREIKPQDLITTSGKAGYAMSVRDYKKAQGAILGKAMTGLKKGETGMVLVLVNLQ